MFKEIFNSALPFSDKVIVSGYNLEELITSLFTVTSVEKVLQWYRPLEGANHIDWLLLCPPVI